MKKTLLIALILCVIAFAGIALAGGQTNPRMHEMLESVQIRQGNCPLPNSDRGVSVQLKCTSVPTLDNHGRFKAVISGGDPADYLVLFGITDNGRDDAGYIYYGPKTDNLTFDGVQMYSTGSYIAWVFLYSKANPDECLGYHWYYFSVDGPETATIEYRAAQIAAQCMGEDEWHTAFNLHEWLTHNVYYDLNYEYYGADVLFSGIGVCDSYSKAYRALCLAAGIPVGRIISDEINHAWNTVMVDGKWYQTDVTWDDPAVGTDAVSGYEGYWYFCLNDELMFSDHGSPVGITYNSPYSEQKPDCLWLDAHYYIHENAWTELCYDCGYDYDTGSWYVIDRRERVREQLDEGEIWVNLEWDTYWWLDSAGELHGRYMDKGKCEMLTYALCRAAWTLSDGNAVTASAGYYKDENNQFRLTFLVTGWAIDEAGTLELPSELESVEAYAFYGSAATTLVIPTSVNSIGEYAFAGSAIRTIVTNNRDLYIPESAFSGCGRLMFFVPFDDGPMIDYALEHGAIVIVC